ncbi:MULTISPECIES: cysteine hydrolase family protein [Streptomyces]|uniref:Cysteine hydrolase n=2 Tax=Streptomyces violaceusniger group TaxID=2839105 RepID=A0ABD5JNS7_9ACTN|nr:MULTISPECIES: cysteine hydrolase [Streptomyces]MEE4589720.1 cysteine hydrolase [Streptomyces sp. DSM 41602]WJE00827.1 cysteine hydrolase [Streptomyces antimycoticus]WTA80409.1 cysteine hydrolase [Streptomyces antimycoticus]WTB09400.1 cysteine hydrolase [Streptomyces antimycoticus]
MTRRTNTALIVGDMQTGILANYPFSRAPLHPMQSFVSVAREHGILVVFVRTELRASGVDVSENNTSFTALHQAGTLFHEGSGETDVVPQLAPQAEDVVITKRRTSAFVGTELDLVLRARHVESILLTGVATSAMVAATLYDALDRDYRLTVMSDACADAEADVHDFFMERVFPGRGAQVMTVGSWLGER